MERKIVSLTKANNSESEEEKEKKEQLDSWTAEENQRSRSSGPVLGINWSHQGRSSFGPYIEVTCI